MAILKAGILGGIVLFIWSAISWMVLPWHNATMNTFSDEKAVVETIKANAPHSGIYFFPSKYENATNTEVVPMVFTSVYLEGMSPSMTMPLIIGLITQIIAACLAAWLLFKTPYLTYFRRVGFVVVVGVIAGLVTLMPNWNWFRFDAMFSLVEFADLLIGWFLAGLVLAALYKPQLNRF